MFEFLSIVIISASVLIFNDSKISHKLLSQVLYSNELKEQSKEVPKKVNEEELVNNAMEDRASGNKPKGKAVKPNGSLDGKMEFVDMSDVDDLYDEDSFSPKELSKEFIGDILRG